jgi:hypothetical protein
LARPLVNGRPCRPRRRQQTPAGKPLSPLYGANRLLGCGSLTSEGRQHTCMGTHIDPLRQHRVSNSGIGSGMKGGRRAGTLGGALSGEDGGKGMVVQCIQWDTDPPPTTPAPLDPPHPPAIDCSRKATPSNPLRHLQGVKGGSGREGGGAVSCICPGLSSIAECTQHSRIQGKRPHQQDKFESRPACMTHASI